MAKKHPPIIENVADATEFSRRQNLVRVDTRIPLGIAPHSIALAVYSYLLAPTGWELIARESNYGPDKYRVVT